MKLEDLFYSIYTWFILINDKEVLLLDNKFINNLVAFITGIVIFATDLFTQIPSADRIGITLFGGYLFLSIYHAWQFAAPRISNLTSMVVFWLFPAVFGFTVVGALLIGLIVSIPKFIISYFKWQTTKSRSKYHQMQKQHSPQRPSPKYNAPIVQRPSNPSNVIPMIRNK